MPDTTSTAPSLMPCPFCGAGDTQIHVNKGTWTGQGFGEPVSVEVRHWCLQDMGQPSRGIVRVGRDEASAIAAWNRRAPQPVSREPLSDEQIRAMCKQSWVFDTAKQWVRITECAHGIGIKNGGSNGN